MLTAITRTVSSALADCELALLACPIDMGKAGATSRVRKGARFARSALISLREVELPDSMFVEDPAIVLDELRDLSSRNRNRGAKRPHWPKRLGRSKIEHQSAGTVEAAIFFALERNIRRLTARTNEKAFVSCAIVQRTI